MIRLLVVLGLQVVLTAQDAAETDDPGKVVQALQKGLLSAVADANLTLDQRKESVVRIIAKTHDLEGMAGSLLGASWESLKAEEQSRCEAALGKLWAARYLAGIDGTPTFGAPRRAPAASDASSAVVASKLERTGDEEVALEYRLRMVSGAWRIFDTIEDGVDWQEAQRAALAHAAESGSLPRFIDRLEQRSASYGASPTQVVQRLQEKLLAGMKAAKKLGFDGRYQVFAPVVEEGHYFSAMSLLILGGKSWRNLSPQQRDQFLSTFRELSVTTYAAEFDGYSGETFAVLGEGSPDRHGHVTVNARLTKGNGELVSFKYVLRRDHKRWKIFNILVDGVSDLSTKRAEYRSIIKKHGFAALIAKIKEKIGKNRRSSKG